MCGHGRGQIVYLLRKFDPDTCADPRSRKTNRSTVFYRRHSGVEHCPTVARMRATKIRTAKEAASMQKPVTTYYLEIFDRADLKPAKATAEPLEIRQVQIPLPELNRMLYLAVGRDYHWRVRDQWSRERWLEYMGRPELETWVAYVQGTPAGYYEQELLPK